MQFTNLCWFRGCNAGVDVFVPESVCDRILRAEVHAYSRYPFLAIPGTFIRQISTQETKVKLARDSDACF